MASRQELVKQVNRLSDEVFGLYYAGFHSEAMAEAQHLRAIARDKLGMHHSLVAAIEENMDFMRSNPVASRNTVTHRKEFKERKERIFHIKRQIVEVEESLQLREEEPERVRMPLPVVLVTAVLLALVAGISVWQLWNSNGPEGVTVTGGSNKPRVINANAVFSMKLQESALLTVPTVCQYPELPRGCEVTSLSMMLQYAGFDVEKMALAAKVRKNPARMQTVGGQIHFGNPERGFVGDMYSLRNPGLGVYAEPIAELARQYLGDRVADLSGRPMDDLYLFVNNGIPVWVVTNTEFAAVPSSYFATWITEDGPIRITYKQHAVLITGYDADSVYINDPRWTSANMKVDRKGFEEAWVQMGRQAVSYLPEGLTAADFLK